MKNIFLILLISLSIVFHGCIIYDEVSYTIKLKSQNNGVVTIKFKDIKSDAIGNKEFEEDKTALLDYMLKSDDFLISMKEEGKEITSRNLFVNQSDNKLNGEVIYKFDNINNVEGIVFQEGYYFLTLELKDSILTTNGQVVYSDDHKRIIWDNSINELTFAMKTDVSAKSIRSFIPFMNK